MSDGARERVAHIVYFTLKDKSDQAVNSLLDACQHFLTNHPGTDYFSVGTLVPDLDREVNQRDFEVGLHVVFADRASHDTYQVSERHVQFIEQNRDNWEKVRVFDSYV